MSDDQKFQMILDGLEELRVGQARILEKQSSHDTAIALLKQNDESRTWWGRAFGVASITALIASIGAAFKVTFKM